MEINVLDSPQDEPTQVSKENKNLKLCIKLIVGWLAYLVFRNFTMPFLVTAIHRGYPNMNVFAIHRNTQLILNLVDIVFFILLLVLVKWKFARIAFAIYLLIQVVDIGSLILTPLETDFPPLQLPVPEPLSLPE